MPQIKQIPGAEALTGLLLLQRHLVPVNLHPVAQLHPQIRLLLRRHRLPSLLDTGQRWVGNGVFGCRPGLLCRNALLLGLGLRTRAQARHWAAVASDRGRGEGRTARGSSSDGAEEHGDDETDGGPRGAENKQSIGVYLPELESGILDGEDNNGLWVVSGEWGENTRAEGFLSVSEVEVD